MRNDGRQPWHKVRLQETKTFRMTQEESWWEPQTHHTIICKKCNKKSIVSMRITRLCLTCQHVENKPRQGVKWQKNSGQS